MTLVVSRIVNDVSYVSRINHECYFVGQTSTGVVFCNTDCSTGIILRSTGVVLCSTE